MVIILLWTLVQAMFEVWYGDYHDHAYYMCLAILTSQSPAFMRLFVIPMISTLRYRWLFDASHHDDPEWKRLTTGEWLLVKETSYTLQSIALIMPFCWPSSPFYKQAHAWWRHMHGEHVAHSRRGQNLKRTNSTGSASVVFILILVRDFNERVKKFSREFQLRGV